MPETIEKSGLPFHINGSFGLRDDRRDFKWMSEDCHLDESAQWNELMVNEVLNRTLNRNDRLRQISDNRIEWRLWPTHQLLLFATNLGEYEP